MTTPDIAGPVSVEARCDGVPGRVLLSGATGRIVLAGFSGAALPEVVTSPRLVRCDAGTPAQAWRLDCAEGSFVFTARAVERQAPCPRLFDALLAPHALKPGARMAARGLLWLMRWPGGARLLRAWHARRR